MRNWKAIIVVIALSYALITAAVTYPVVLHTTSALAGLNNEDAQQHMWLLWWTKKALLDLHINPADLTHLYYPSEPYHPMLIVNPFVQLVALPLLLVAGPIAAYNMEFLLSFVLTGITAYLLCYYLTRNVGASFVGGVIFAFFPNKMLHSLGHLPQMTLYLFPLYVLFLFLLLEKPSLGRAISLGLIAALSALVHIIHIAYFLVPCTLVFFLWHLYTDRRRILAPGFLKHGALAILLVCVLTAPIFGPFLVDKLSGELTYLQAGGSEMYSAGALSLFTPSSDHPVLGTLLQQSPFAIPGHKDDETLVYVGLTTLCLAAVGCKGSGKGKGMWAALGISTAILALGPFLKFGGEPVKVAVQGEVWRIPLPYALVLRLPFYEWGRIPGRLLESVMFSLAVLASYGTASLLTRLRRLRTKTVLVGGLTTLILSEYVIVFPFPVGQTPIPDFYRQLAVDPQDYAILDIPFSGWSATNTNMYYQTVHGHPIVGGFVYRVPAGVRPMMNYFRLLVRPPTETDDIVEPLNGTDRAAILHHYDIRYVILHKPALLSQELLLWLDWLGTLHGQKAYEDEQIVAFRVPEVDDTPPLKPLLVLGEDWHDVQFTGDGPSRWMANDGVVYAGVPQDGEYELTLVAASDTGPRRLRVYVNDREAGELSVDGRQAYTVGPLTLEGEDWATIRFHAVEGCQESADLGLHGQTAKCSSLVFQNVRLEPR